MCLYGKLIDNPKYKANKKNGGVIPAIPDIRVGKVPIGCKLCVECMRDRARNWGTRLQADIKENTNGKFVTLTFSNESYAKLAEGLEGLEGYVLENAIATKAMRYFLERWRRKFGKSVRHFMVTELGHNGTENIHLHGIIWTDESYDVIRERWGYGYIWPREKWQERRTYVNERTVNYIIKYITKADVKHKQYVSAILTSDGIGSNYPKSIEAQKHKYRTGGETIEIYKTRTGTKRGLPLYWKNKFFSEDEREKLWLEKLDKMERWVMGEKIDISKGLEEYEKALEYARRDNRKLGYGGEPLDWEEAEREKAQRILLQQTRIALGKERLGPAGPVNQKGPDYISGSLQMEDNGHVERGKQNNKSGIKRRPAVLNTNTKYKRVLINNTWYEIREDGIRAVKEK